jgi:predicted translin family RNA/ssDNA-binding protein
MEDPSTQQSPFMPMFETFRAELDEHHDRRERTIKASRDITAASKKMFVSWAPVIATEIWLMILQHLYTSKVRLIQSSNLSTTGSWWYIDRIRKLGQPLPAHVNKNNAQYYDIIKERYNTVSAELQGLNAWRYARNITGGNQEYMEAAIFQHYLTTGTLLTYEDSVEQLRTLGGEGGPVQLTVEDYLLGVFDMTGELMRFSITTMATDGKLPSVESSEDAADKMDVDAQAGSSHRDVLTDLRSLRSELEGLNVGFGSSFARDVDKKMDVMQTSVEKVEKALYGLVIRGRERPKGWMPDLDSGPRRDVEVDAWVWRLAEEEQPWTIKLCQWYISSYSYVQARLSMVLV